VDDTDWGDDPGETDPCALANTQVVAFWLLDTYGCPYSGKDAAYAPLKPPPAPCYNVPVATGAVMVYDVEQALDYYGLSAYIQSGSYTLVTNTTGAIITGVDYKIIPGDVTQFEDALKTGPYSDCFYQDLSIGNWFHYRNVGVGILSGLFGGGAMGWRGYQGQGISQGSLQIVIGTTTGLGYADIDEYNTQDLWNLAHHLGGMIPKPGHGHLL
jgi:hypothetical protein